MRAPAVAAVALLALSPARAGMPFMLILIMD